MPPAGKGNLAGAPPPLPPALQRRDGADRPRSAPAAPRRGAPLTAGGGRAGGVPVARQPRRVGRGRESREAPPPHRPPPLLPPQAPPPPPAPPAAHMCPHPAAGRAVGAGGRRRLPDTAHGDSSSARQHRAGHPSGTESRRPR